MRIDGGGLCPRLRALYQLRKEEMKMLLLSQSTITNGRVIDVIINTEENKFEMLSTKKKYEKAETQYCIKMYITNGSVSEYHNDEVVARKRIRYILTAFGFSDDDATEFANNIDFIEKE